MEKDLSSQTVKQLTDKLRKLGLKVSGNKAELIQRIITFKHSTDTPYEHLKVTQLKILLRERNLPVSGLKKILVSRLYDYDRTFITEVPEDIYKEILLNLDDRDLANMCSTNKRAKKICNDDKFWNLRIQKIYNSDLSKYKHNKKYKEMYKELTKNGDDIDEVLFRASELGYLPVVKYLIENEENIDGKTIDYALYKASKEGQLSVVKYLIEKLNADVHAQGDGALRGASERDIYQ